MCVNMCVEARAQGGDDARCVCIDVYIDMGTNICVDMGQGYLDGSVRSPWHQTARVYRRVYRQLCRHVRRVCRHVYEHA